MSDYDDLRLCPVCRDAFTTGRLCRACAFQEGIDGDVPDDALMDIGGDGRGGWDTDCPRCGGGGIYLDDSTPCPYCDGTGTKQEDW